VEDIAKTQAEEEEAQNQNQQLFCSPPLGLLSSFVLSLSLSLSLSLLLLICSSFIDWLSGVKEKRRREPKTHFNFDLVPIFSGMLTRCLLVLFGLLPSTYYTYVPYNTTLVGRYPANLAH